MTTTEETAQEDAAELSAPQANHDAVSSPSETVAQHESIQSSPAEATREPPDLEAGRPPTRQLSSLGQASNRSVGRMSGLQHLKLHGLAPKTPVSPFVGRWKTIEGPWNIARTVLLSPVGLVRLILVILLIALAALWCRLMMIGASKSSEDGSSFSPPAKWRTRCIRGPLRVVSRSVLFVLGFYYIPVKGRRDRKAPVVVSNHTTLVDVVVLLWATAPSFLSKASVLQVPLIGSVCKGLQVIGVHRVDRSNRKDTMQRMKAHVESEDTPPLLIFPEGTTSRADTMLRFKPGAFALGVPIQPVMLIWSFRFWDPSSCATTDVVLWLVQLLTQVYHTVAVEFLPTIVPTLEEMEDAGTYALTARAQMLKCLNRRHLDAPKTVPYVIPVDQTVDDFLVWKRFHLARVPDYGQSLVTFSLQNVRKTLTLATRPPIGSKLVDTVVNLSFVLAAAERHLALWALRPDQAGLVDLDVLALTSLGLEKAPEGVAHSATAQSVLISAWRESAVYKSSELDETKFDFRSFCMALLYLSPVTPVWGPERTRIYVDDTSEPGVTRWAAQRSRLIFALMLASSSTAAPAVTRREAELVLGLPDAWDVLVPSSRSELSLQEFQDVVVGALKPFDGSSSSSHNGAPSVEAESEWIAKREAAGRFLEAGFRVMDENFVRVVSRLARKPASELKSLFLSDAELGFEIKRAVEFRRAESFEDPMVTEDVEGEAELEDEALAARLKADQEEEEEGNDDGSNPKHQSFAV